MKNLVFTLIGIIPLALTGCSKDKEINIKKEADFSLKEYQYKPDLTARQSASKPIWATYVGDKSDNPVGCEGEPKDCIILEEVVVIGKKSDSFINPNVLEAHKKGKITLEVKENNKAKYKVFTDSKGNKLVYMFKK